MAEITPTAEQQHTLDLVATGSSVAIEAGAGTGKTATLVMIAKLLGGKRVQYVAFNKAIVTEAGEKMPSNVTCSTAHSLAYRAIATDGFKRRQKQGKRMRSLDIANVLRIDGMTIKSHTGQDKQLSRTFLAGLVMGGVNRFCQTADPEPTFRHVPRVDALDAEGDWTANREVAKHCEAALRRAWADLTSEHGSLPFTTSTAMSVYLKLWQLSGPRIGADVILFDEAQDANPVMVAVVAAQAHAQIVWVGDSQQQIYAFTGAVNALQTVPSDHRAFLTQSFRFGPAVADVANAILAEINGAELRLVGSDTVTSVVGPIAEPDVILSRTNASAVRAVLEAQSQDKRPHLVGGGVDIVRFTKAAAMLQQGQRVDHPELACFESWLEVQEYVEQDEQGDDLRLMVKLIDEFGTDTILGALDNMVREPDADVVVSTAHKSKGREWNSVQLAGDFPEPKRDEETGQVKPLSDDELRLMYVAVTRAKRELDVDAVLFIRERVGGSPAPIVATVTKPAPARQDDVSRDPKPTPTPTTPKPSTTSSHVGTVGQDVTVTAKVERVGSPTKYGSLPVTMVDGDGNRLVLFTKDDMAVGAIYTGTFKVVKHDEFKGARETRLSHPRGLTKIDTTEAASAASVDVYVAGTDRPILTGSVDEVDSLVEYARNTYAATGQRVTVVQGADLVVEFDA